MNVRLLRPGTAPSFMCLSAMGDALTGLLGRLPARGIAGAATLMVATAAAVDAAEDIQDWIPEAIEMPGDAEVVTDRAIGSSVRLFSISTGAEVDALLAEWEEGLSRTGYRIFQEEGELLDHAIEFSGPGIANAKIIVAPTTEDGRSVIEFDATLD